MPRALLSVYDKSGIVELASALVELGWEVVSSGGTAKAVAAAGLPVIDVAELTGFEPILGHRVVTLHPAVHAALLADLDEPSHRDDLARMGIEPFSLAVINLYPFTSNPSIELIDVGGPTMVRAAAKNHAHVAVVVDPADYSTVVDELRAQGAVSPATRRRLARDAFAHTASYDAAIVSWFDDGDPQPPTLHLALERADMLRYGENPHQSGARYRRVGQRSWWDDAVQHGGKQMSYLNVYDTDAAWRLVHRFDEPAAVVVKHANPCGVALGVDIADAYRRAHACDPVSAFGGIVACNRTVTAELARELAPVFTEVLVAPAFDAEALEVLASKPNLRVLSGPAPAADVMELRTIDGGFLVQDRDMVRLDRAECRVVTIATPSEDDWRNLEVAWQVVAAVSSNAIVLVGDHAAVGIGAGQQNRLDSARIALEKAPAEPAGERPAAMRSSRSVTASMPWPPLGCGR